jgi:hypothetical protein
MLYHENEKAFQILGSQPLYYILECPLDASSIFLGTGSFGHNLRTYEFLYHSDQAPRTLHHPS